MKSVSPRLFLVFLCSLTTACMPPTAKAPVSTVKPSLLFVDADVKSLTMNLRCPSKPLVQRGLSHILVYHNYWTFEPTTYLRNILFTESSASLPLANEKAHRWMKTGEPANASLGLSKSELLALARAIDNLELPGEPAMTFGIVMHSKLGPKPKGVPSAEYLATRANAAGLEIYTSTVVDGWGRARWIVVPWEKCSEEMFARIEQTCSNEQLKRLVHLLKIHYEANKH